MPGVGEPLGNHHVPHAQDKQEEVSQILSYRRPSNSEGGVLIGQAGIYIYMVYVGHRITHILNVEW